ncbi:MAG: class C beta-lactamase-related serine hydrolase [Sphingomonadaceae bacterium]|nr:class C beta-lactamase-related serine hydrolase [Sphingomonadaceae bacterium]
MSTRRLPFILPLLALPSLIACGPQQTAQEPPPPLAPAAMNAVIKTPGVPREALARAVDKLFSTPETAETRAVVVLHDGQIVAERYASGYHENTRFVSWSMAKTITGVLIGLLVADGRLRLDESAPVPAWQRPGDPRGEITLRQLLQMRSGLRHTEAGEPVYESDEVRMLFLDGRDAMASHAEAQPLEAEPGRKWEYSSATTVILADLAARTLTPSNDPAERRKVVNDYLRSRLFEPLGMKSIVPEYDAAGTLIGGSLMHATARDWARFGEFLRNKGSVGGAQLVPPGWIEFMTTANPRNRGYGAQIWLNRPQPGEQEVPFPGAPRSAFSLNGHLGQFVLVSPAQNLTVVRLGRTLDGSHNPVKTAMGQIVRLYSSGK